MDENNVGSVIVIDEEEQFVGIFTERDIMHCAGSLQSNEI